MICQQVKPILGPYADGELEAAAIQELDEHIKTCPDCSRELKALHDLRKTLRADTMYFSAPAELRKRIMAELPKPKERARQQTAWSWNWLTTLMSGTAAACLALLLTVTLARNSSEPGIAKEIVSSHIRSLMASHSLDVASTDQHTVKPWFDGKLDFAPPVIDLVSQEFPLQGGRLDYVDGQTVAALVFKRQKHIINLFIWPTKESDSKPAVSPSIQGYNLVHWSQAGMKLWAVSDLNEKELSQFAETFSSTAH